MGAAYAQAPVTQGMTQRQATEQRLEQRLERVERLLENRNLVELYTRLESLQREVENLRGQADVLNHELEGIKKRQRDLYLDIDHRMQQMEAAVKEALAKAEAASQAPPSGPALPPGLRPSAPPLAPPLPGGGSAPPAGGAPAAGESDAYEAAFAFLKDGNYQQAINAFQVFLQQYPQGNFADNAQYWLGEARYVTRDFAGAIAEFNKVLSQFPNSSKVADAQLKIGFSYYELAQYPKAKQALEAVVKNHPNTTAARLAQKRLQQMKLEGR